jgi:hypothetical protein
MEDCTSFQEIAIHVNINLEQSHHVFNFRMIKSNIPVNGDEMHSGWQLGDCTYSCNLNVYRQAGSEVTQRNLQILMGNTKSCYKRDKSSVGLQNFSGFMCIKIKCIKIVRDCRKTSKKTAKNKVTLYIHSFIPHQSHQLRSKHKTYPTYCFSFSGTLKMNPFLVFPKLAAAKEPQDDPFRVCALHSAAQDESRASREAESGLYQRMGSPKT